ncbi:ABC transporter ATP-binding protein/permease [Enterococcus alishanensis]
MLELHTIKKYYHLGEMTTKALDGISVSFRRQEFVAILGPSGSGKTTMLNVIGGLDNYDSGDMIIDGKSTKTFKENDWDAFRNNSIGFVFQSYNLINHLGIIDNVELGMTLSGVAKEEKRQKAEEALRRVGLADHMHKKPNQLSGGQMQRVAIARALANDPDILLCDEPTGALDTETSVQIMNLIQELSLEKLVIMVTHNPNLAHQYADRIIEFSDGQILNDSHPHKKVEEGHQFVLKRTKMRFTTALKLSFHNLKTKKGRTFLTAFASSIGIISIGIVLSLASGFQVQINRTQTETLAKFPITISKTVTDQSDNSQQALGSEKGDFSKRKQITAKISEQDRVQHTNKIDQNYLDYIKNIDPKLSNNIGYTRMVEMNLLGKLNDSVEPVSFSTTINDEQNTNSMDLDGFISNMTGVGVSTFPTQLTKNTGDNFLKDNYQLLSGNYPKATTDVVLIVDANNNTNLNSLKNIGFEIVEDQALDFNQIVGTTFKLIHNNDYYTQTAAGNFVPNNDYQALYDNPNNRTVTISGILRVKPNAVMNLLAPGIAYSNELTTEIVNENQHSAIVDAQKNSESSVISNQPLTDEQKETTITQLGGDSLPANIMVYPNNYQDKEEILNYLDAYNTGKSKEERILYTDLAGTMTELTGGLMKAITYVLIAFAGISLVTSMIMIGIITYTSVIERTKEIGVLKALGARKKDITRVFDAETCILGLSSGILGVLFAWGATVPVNILLYNLTDLKDVAQLNPIHAVILIVVSTILTMLGGHIPARLAAKKDAAIALRAE